MARGKTRAFVATETEKSAMSLSTAFLAQSDRLAIATDHVLTRIFDSANPTIRRVLSEIEREIPHDLWVEVLEKIERYKCISRHMRPGESIFKED